MFEQLTSRMDSLSNALQLRAHRQQVLASNIANADSPGYQARDFDFAAALTQANAGGQSASTVGVSHAGHLQGVGGHGGAAGQVRLAYTQQTQPSLDGNSVDLDQQRANFTDNAIRYESTLRFINGHVKTMLSAIQGQ